jgi:hypothetical protein
LEAKGWSVIIVWECELKKEQFEETIKRVEKEILSNGELYRLQKEERRKERDKWLSERRFQKLKTESLLNAIKHL